VPCAERRQGQLRRYLANSQSAPQQFPDSGIVESHPDIGKPPLVCWIMQLIDAE